MDTQLRVMALAALSVGIATLCSCGGDETSGPDQQQPPTVSSVSVAPSSHTLVSIGETVQLTATARDASGNTISGKTYTWSSSDADVAMVSQSGVVTAVVNGSADISASTDGISGATTILVDQVGSYLVFITQPTTTKEGEAIAPVVEVAIQDAGGSTVTDAVDPVTVAISTNSGNGVLSGTTTVSAVAGVASFTDLAIDQEGIGYTLVATSGNLDSPTSTTFAILGEEVHIVNTVDDGDDGTCDAAHCSLREALNTANAEAGSDVIGFGIPGSGPRTIQPLSVLPTVTDYVVIDGYTQSGSSPNTNGWGNASNAVLTVELNGSEAGDDASGLVITSGGSTVRGLAISQFGAHGIKLEATSHNVVAGNFIGTDVTGTVAVGNGKHGVALTSSDNTIGGTTAEARNIISGNQADGVNVSAEGGIVYGNVVQGNLIGTDVTGTLAIANGNNGINIAADTNTIGGTGVGAGNIISGNSLNGITLSAAYGSAAGNLIQGNYIGTDISGTSRLANGLHGVNLVFASENTIGGTTEGSRNTISGNWGNGIAISEEFGQAWRNVIQGNYIGTDVTGTSALGNGNHGIEITADSNTVGGNEASARNLISGNTFNGITIAGTYGSASWNQIQGNYIGTDVTGTARLGNGEDGVSVADASRNTIGGTTVGARNLISGNAVNGVEIIYGSATDNLVAGNYIGTDAAGAVALGNGNAGVMVDGAPGNTIGGTSGEARNLISGNLEGVTIAWGNATGNRVLGNYIGTDYSGTAAVGNTAGVLILASGNAVGGTIVGAHNVISGNTGYGIGMDDVGATSGNSFRGNHIFSNGELGIDLFPAGVTPNDAGDGDTGPNNLQNFPVLSSASSDGGTVTVVGSLNSAANTDFTLEFFANSACDPSGNGEGEIFLGSATVATNGSGDASFTVTLTASVSTGQFLTATATDPDNNTSEFSQCATVTS